MIAGAAPECFVFPVEKDGIDGTAGAPAQVDFITHLRQLSSYGIRCAAVQQNVTGPWLPVIHFGTA